MSAGSACTSGSLEPSYVITAMGVPVDWALGAVRTSLGAGTTVEDIDYVLEILPAVVQRIRSMSARRSGLTKSADRGARSGIGCTTRGPR